MSYPAPGEPEGSDRFPNTPPGGSGDPRYPQSGTPGEPGGYPQQGEPSEHGAAGYPPSEGPYETGHAGYEQPSAYESTESTAYQEPPPRKTGLGRVPRPAWIIVGLTALLGLGLGLGFGLSGNSNNNAGCATLRQQAPAVTQSLQADVNANDLGGLTQHLKQLSGILHNAAANESGQTATNITTMANATDRLIGNIPTSAADVTPTTAATLQRDSAALSASAQQVGKDCNISGPTFGG